MQHLLLSARLPIVLDIGSVSKLLEELAEVLELKVAFGPAATAFEDGASAFVIVSESHISFHQVQEKVWIDVFSCKDFRIEKVLDMLNRWEFKDLKNLCCLKR